MESNNVKKSPSINPTSQNNDNASQQNSLNNNQLMSGTNVEAPVKLESPTKNYYNSNNVSSSSEIFNSNNFDQCDSSSSNMILRKRVNFKLNNSNNNEENKLICNNKINTNFNNQSLVKFDVKKQQKLPAAAIKNSGIIDLKTRDMCPLLMTRETKIKNVVYNGTYPIDNPISSRFDEAYGDDEEEGEDYYKEDDGVDEDYDEDDYEPDKHPSYTMKELIENKNIKINYNKMKFDFQQSFLKFDQFLDRRSGGNRRRVQRGEINEIRSFDIDEPM